MNNSPSHLIGHILDKALNRQELSVDEGILLYEAKGDDFQALCESADELRKRQVGDKVRYVVNRNINFTNVCIKNCQFCAFSRNFRSEEGYFLDEDEILRRVEEAQDLGATEVCIQAGLAPSMKGDEYIRLCKSIKTRFPSIHIHAFSPEEVKYGASLLRISYKEYLQELKNAGIGSLPGTSAEILDDTLRKKISPTRIKISEWIEIIESAHSLEIPTTSTMMYGHLESVEDRIKHLETLRSLQKKTGGFSEFVPLPFIYQEAPLSQTTFKANMATSEVDKIKTTAISRLFLGNWIPNIQVSWVKDGPKLSQKLLQCGANDFGGTLINESISTSAGSLHGQLLTPSQIETLILEINRIPQERDTLYNDIETTEKKKNNAFKNDYGSYHALTQEQRFSYQHR
jgi:FO synthase subunit 2